MFHVSGEPTAVLSAVAVGITFALGFCKSASLVVQFATSGVKAVEKEVGSLAGHVRELLEAMSALALTVKNSVRGGSAPKSGGVA